ncbi:MFS general substrate transporter [Laetiporus sulphureus 93-53]|uniref:MFS general substrate transporter n=1 Tax=Laetiporus sulphureus 93-53 TaxID=1314785 RepID=A0A165BHT9_9APHY|nr:MFS general substrate transporter [Laetiporus sulphureus 93-53]KZT01084.1 MFS general substrate transporter [Laetiporus sulphureus 93-53]
MSFTEKNKPVDTDVVQISENIDEDLSRQVMRKLDWHLLPILSGLYLLAYFTTLGSGNAKIAGLTTDLGLKGVQFNLCSALFFIPYCLLDVPSNVALKYFKPSRWIPSIMFSWSIVMICMTFVKNFRGLLVARLFLGLTEAGHAGLFPGISFYICLWYPRRAQAQRLSIFLSASSTAGAFGGLLAFAIEKMNGIGGLAGWSWIFLLEGLVTTVISLLAFYWMDDYPETASFLTEKEREWLVRTIREDTVGSPKSIETKYIMQALADPHAYLMATLDFFMIIPLYSSAVFLPTIIVGLGYSSIHAQLMTIPPNICGSLCTVILGMFSDRLGARGPFVLLASLLSLTGYVMLFATTASVTGYVGTMIAASGVYPASACLLAWTSGNAGGDIKRGVMIAMLGCIGNSGTIVASFIYRQADSPRYHPGHATSIACSSTLALLTIVAMLRFSQMNAKKKAYCLSEDLSDSQAHEYSELGDRSPFYRCVIDSLTPGVVLWLICEQIHFIIFAHDEMNRCGTRSRTTRELVLYDHSSNIFTDSLYIIVLGYRTRQLCVHLGNDGVDGGVVSASC